MTDAKTLDRGQSSARMVVTLVIILVVGGILAATLMPVALDQLTDDKTTEFENVDVGDTEAVAGNLDITLDNVNDTANDISVTLEDADGNTASLTNVSATQTATVGGDNVDVTLDNVDDGDTADFTVVYAADFGWSSGGQALWAILDLVLVLAAFLFFVAVAMKFKP